MKEMKDTGKMTKREELALTGLAAIGLGAATVFRFKKKREERKRKKMMLGEDVTSYKSALKAYVDEVAENRVSSETREDLKESLEQLKENHSEEELSSIFSGLHYAPVVEIIYDYTVKAAEGMEIAPPRYQRTSEILDSILYYLKAQE